MNQLSGPPMTDVNLADAAPIEADDLAMARRIAGGDRLAFELLMRRYNRRLYRVARATLHDEAEAQDALQDAYLRAFRSMHQFRGEAALSTWLTRLVLNECLGRLRRTARRQNVIPLISSNPEGALLAMAAPVTEQPDKSLGLAQMRALLERKLGELPEAFRVVFVLRAVEEMSVDETAQCLDIPAETVRSRHFRARGLLREALAQEIDLAERDVFEFGGEHCDRIVNRVLEQLEAGSGCTVRARYAARDIKA
jgi:RNA polymerase sigma factor (sigma-70 family)